VNESQIKFFFLNRPMSQVQIPKSEPYKKVMNIPTNNVDPFDQLDTRLAKNDQNSEQTSD
jgi:hypothetical protein